MEKENTNSRNYSELKLSGTLRIHFGVNEVFDILPRDFLKKQ